MPASSVSPNRLRLLSRAITLAVAFAAVGSLLLLPASAAGWAVDIALRTYLMFLCAVMSHEASHGHLAATRRGNHWWGRLAHVPLTVPYVSFRETHLRHHAHTNEPGLDPDLFMRPRRDLEIPLRALALPHQWALWLWQRRLVTPAMLREWLGSYLVTVVVFGGLMLVVGPGRVLGGMLPSLALVSLVLWWPFAIRTHEGFSTGPAAERSHDYLGQAAYWLTLGLSMHRAHHLRPGISWLELRRFVRPAPPWRPFARDLGERGVG